MDIQKSMRGNGRGKCPECGDTDPGLVCGECAGRLLAEVGLRYQAEINALRADLRTSEKAYRTVHAALMDAYQILRVQHSNDEAQEWICRVQREGLNGI